MGYLYNQFVAGAAALFLAVFLAVLFFVKTLSGKFKNFAFFIGSSPSPFAFYVLVNFTFWHICSPHKKKFNISYISPFLWPESNFWTSSFMGVQHCSGLCYKNGLFNNYKQFAFTFRSIAAFIRHSLFQSFIQHDFHYLLSQIN